MSFVARPQHCLGGHHQRQYWAKIGRYRARYHFPTGCRWFGPWKVSSWCKWQVASRIVEWHNVTHWMVEGTLSYEARATRLHLTSSEIIPTRLQHPPRAVDRVHGHRAADEARAGSYFGSRHRNRWFSALRFSGFEHQMVLSIDGG